VTVLVTGAGGQLGHDLVDVYADREVVGLTRGQLDVTDEAAVVAAITDLAPSLVINAAAWTDVDGCEADEVRAHRTNALGPWWLARACHLVGATLVTISTDYVFSGQAPTRADGTPRAWTEADAVAPINAYGRSKAAGEQLVRETLREHHIVRTAWVAGARGDNFVRTMLRLARERDVVEVVDDQFGSPTYSRDLAVAIRELAATGRYGTVHRTGAGVSSWHDLAATTFEYAGLDVDLRRTTSTALPRPAARPTWSVLSATHATAMGLTPLPAWQDGVRRLLQELGELRGAATP
jgi:dTDP-4-dehydrorhamnose reductase